MEPTDDKPTSSLVPSGKRNEKDLAFCQMAVETIMSAYPSSTLPDPEGYIRNLREAFLVMPRSQVSKAADPRTGIVTKCKWLPSIAEIVDFAKPDPGKFPQLKFPEEEPIEISDEDREYISKGLEQLSEDLKHKNAISPEQIAKEKRMRERFKRSQCKSHQAIRRHYGMSLVLEKNTDEESHEKMDSE